MTSENEDHDRVSPTFKIFSGTLKAFEKDDGRKYLTCIASSTIEDLHGDRMTAECVQDMAPQAKTKGMTIFLNHSYKVPEDVFGKTTDAKIVSRAQDEAGAIYDLDLEIMLNESNQRAVDTYLAIKDQGMKMGVSIGAMIEDWAFMNEDEGWFGGLEIRKVDLLEASIVGIPANQRSWVINSLNALGAPRDKIAKALGKYVEVEVTTAVEQPIENSAAPEEEIPEETESSDELDPADDQKSAAPLDVAKTVEDLKVAGISDGLLGIVLGFLEGATEEVVSLREALTAMTSERDQALDQVRQAAEIVETIASTPIGRKAQFTGPVSDFRTRFGGLYDASVVRLLDEGDNDLE